MFLTRLLFYPAVLLLFCGPVCHLKKTFPAKNINGKLLYIFLLIFSVILPSLLGMASLAAAKLLVAALLICVLFSSAASLKDIARALGRNKLLAALLGIYTVIFLLANTRDNPLVPNGDITAQAHMAALVKMNNSYPLVSVLADSDVFRIYYPPGIYIFTAVSSSLTGIPIHEILAFVCYLSFLLGILFIFEYSYFLFSNAAVSLTTTFLMITYPYMYWQYSHGMPQKFIAPLLVMLSIRLYTLFLAGGRMNVPLAIFAGATFALSAYFHTLFTFAGACSYAAIALMMCFEKEYYKKNLVFFSLFSLSAGLIAAPYLSTIPPALAQAGAGNGIDHVVYNLLPALKAFMQTSYMLLIPVGLLAALTRLDLMAKINAGYLLGLACLANNFRFYKLLRLPWYAETAGAPHYDRIPTSLYYTEKLFPFLSHHMLLANGFTLAYLVFGAYAIAFVLNKDYSRQISIPVFSAGALLLALLLAVPQYFPHVLIFFFLCYGLATFGIMEKLPRMRVSPVPSTVLAARGAVGLLVLYCAVTGFSRFSNCKNEIVLNRDEREVVAFMRENLREKPVINYISSTKEFRLFNWWISALSEVRTVFNRPIYSPWNISAVDPENGKRIIAAVEGLDSPETIGSAKFKRFVAEHRIRHLLIANAQIGKAAKWGGLKKELIFSNPGYSVYKLMDGAPGAGKD